MRVTEDLGAPVADAAPSPRLESALVTGTVPASAVRAMTQPHSNLPFDLLLLPIAALVLVGRFGSRDWLLDMTNYFRPHIAVAVLVLVVLAILAGSMPRVVIAIPSSEWQLRITANRAAPNHL